ncbi:hypothetical protein CALK_1867 [Chitinivibrio alkaliphilus ACht1]|uniref:Right handed beta helix domain-containing protein n=2 Tax=Chitinivibrio TaxID=1505231 RepID=U7D412_9BACT|nr:hypothetical protein CALK_1867 [Chitinivibrio alkaliphilus ACht1]
MYVGRQFLKRITLVLLMQTVMTLPVPAEEIVVSPRGSALREALQSAQSGTTIVLEDGNYYGEFPIPPGVTVVSQNLHGAVLNGVGAEHVVTLTNNATLRGVQVQNGRIGVFSRGLDNTIAECRISRNRNSGISSIIAVPEIRDNIIYRNGGSGIQIWVDDKAYNGSIEHNTIAHNENHGISLGGEAEIHVRNNIVAYNKRLTLQVQGPEVTVVQENNNYFGNIEFNMALPEDNFSYDPEFIDARSGNFNFPSSSRSSFDATDRGRLGSRIYDHK